MRALLAIALVGCAENTAIDVELREATTTVMLRDADCSCPYMELGCSTWSDVGSRPEPCSCASSCTDALVELVNGDQVVSMIGQGYWTGDYRGWTLYIRGCGGEAEHVLPTELPVAPTIIEADERFARWDAPGASRVLVSTSSPNFYGTHCQLDGAVTSTPLEGGGTPITVTSIVDLPSVASSIGTIHVHAGASTQR